MDFCSTLQSTAICNPPSRNGDFSNLPQTFPLTFLKMNNLRCELVVGRRIQKVPVGYDIYLAQIREAQNMGGEERNEEGRQILGSYLGINTDNTQNTVAWMEDL